MNLTERFKQAENYPPLFHFQMFIANQSYINIQNYHLSGSAFQHEYHIFINMVLFFYQFSHLNMGLEPFIFNVLFLH